jgi:hypothetical protein
MKRRRRERRALTREKMFYVTILFFLLVGYLCTLNPDATIEFFKVLPAIIMGAV